jgi:hypothetical protein
MVKVVYNDCYGGFGLSDLAKSKYKEITGKEYDEYSDTIENRTDSVLVHLVETLGNQANGKCAKLRIKEFSINLDKQWLVINEYDGLESVKLDWKRAMFVTIEALIKTNASHETIGKRVVEIYKMMEAEKDAKADKQKNNSDKSSGFTM